MLAQIELWTEKETGKYANGKVYVLPKELDEKVARLHLKSLGAKLTTLSAEQSDYVGIPVNGPYRLASTQMKRFMCSLRSWMRRFLAFT